jgi:hypothetical protein
MFYGWYVVGALFFATFLMVGTRNGFGVFIATWEEEWGRRSSASKSTNWAFVPCSSPMHFSPQSH